MTTSLRVVAFVSTLLAVFALALGTGRWVGPWDEAEPASHPTHTESSDEAAGAAEASGAASEAGIRDVSGLTARADGYALALAERQLPAGRGTRLAFTVETSSGRPLLDYETAHEKDLHLIVVRRDLTGFQHVHPTLDRETGRWSVDVDLTPGTWRVIADFVPEGWDGVVLADDLSVAGDYAPRDPGQERRRDRVDGYDVSLTGDSAPGASTTLTTTVERGGDPVTDLQPYLGAHGHLVALRAGDLGYLHVHPESTGDDAQAGPSIAFGTAFPTPGTYRLFLDFRHEGVVRTADFTVHSGGAPAGEAGSPSGAGEHGEDDHDH